MSLFCNQHVMIWFTTYLVKYCRDAIPARNDIEHGQFYYSTRPTNTPIILASDYYVKLVYYA